MADEEVIKRRLLIDGDGTGDDRRLNVLVKSFIKWVNASDSAENIQIGYDRLLAQLAQVEFAATKSDYASRMMKQELRNYEAISQTIDTGIEQAKTQIDQSKENLVMAKKIRKNRMEYDVLAKIISAQPDRMKTTEKLDTLKTELGELEDSRRQLQRKLEVRRNDFAVLMRSIRELQAKLDDEVRIDGDGDDADEGGAESTERMQSTTAASPLSLSGGELVMMESVDDDDDDDDVIGGADGDHDMEMVSADNSTETEESANNVSNGTPEQSGGL